MKAKQKQCQLCKRLTWPIIPHSWSGLVWKRISSMDVWSLWGSQQPSSCVLGHFRHSNKQPTNQVILVQACSLPARGQSFAYQIFHCIALRHPLNTNALVFKGCRSGMCWCHWIKERTSLVGCKCVYCVKLCSLCTTMYNCVHCVQLYAYVQICTIWVLVSVLFLWSYSRQKLFFSLISFSLCHVHITKS